MMVVGQTWGQDTGALFCAVLSEVYVSYLGGEVGEQLDAGA